MSAVPAAHVYRRALDPDGQDSLAKLARLVRPGSQVLDLGAGPGVLGRYLAERLNCTVDGVESNPAAATEAAPWYRRLHCADLERIALVEHFAGCRYDFIVCADVLEHLRQPGTLLAQLNGLLAANGHVLASVPNVAYAGLIADLLAGEFRYRSEGLLDRTHLRFFTLRSLARLLEETRLRAVAVDVVIRDLRESEFAGRYLDALPPALLRGLLGRPEALVYQYIVSARAATEADEIELPPLAGPAPELRFACQLFWRAPEADYRESDSGVSWGRIGASRQAVLLPIPALSNSPQALRLDLSDRPGLLRLYGLALRDGGKRLLWRWDGQRASLAAQPGQQLAFAEQDPSAGGLLVLLAGEDPHLELPVPAPALAALRDGGELAVDLSWPMSSDYLALVQDCIPRRDAAALQATLLGQIKELQAGNAALANRAADLEASVATQIARGTALEGDLAVQTEAKSALEKELAILAARSGERAAAIGALRGSWRERVWAGLRRRWRG